MQISFCTGVSTGSGSGTRLERAVRSPGVFGDGASFWSARVVEAYAKKHNLLVAVVSYRSGQEASTAVIGGHVMAAETGTGTLGGPQARTPVWIDADTYAAMLRNVAEDADKLREYLKK